VVKHYNTSISEDAARILNSKQGQFLGDDVQGPVAVIPIERYCNIIRSNSRNTTGSSTVYTTPTDKDFYLQAVLLSWEANAASDCTEFWVNVTTDTENVASQRILGARRTTLTAGRGEQILSLVKPIKLARNTQVTLNQSFTVGAASMGASVIGYTVETTK